jgi:signal transduction histidine kinase/CheY-like chemotaxis protein/HAMP domain-containing protein
MLDALKFKHRVLLLVALASIALTTVTAMALVLGRRGADDVSGIETRYVPLLELNRDLESTFATVARTLEDAAAAAEEGGLREADTLRDQFLRSLDSGRGHIAENGADPEALRREFVAYYRLARRVSSDLISEETGEDLLERAQAMREAQQQFASHLDTGTTPDRVRLAAAFESARAAHSTAVLVDLTVAGVAFVLMLLLSWWIVRGTVRSLREVSSGVERLARGDFSKEILVAVRDEFGDLAREANRTAKRLREYRELVAQEDWVKTGTGGLAGQIAGELSSSELGRRALTYLARYTDAADGFAYAADEQGQLDLLEGYAFEQGALSSRSFRPGEGIVGQAARDGEMRVLSDMPPGYVSVTSGLGGTGRCHLLVVPCSFEGRCMGVLEFGFLEPPSSQSLELMRRVRDLIGIAFRVAESRERVQALVHEMQQQAEELRDAYDEQQQHNEALLDSKQRLQAQQDELRAANEELERQAETLEAQRNALQAKNEQLVVAHQLIEQKAAEVTRASKYKSEFLANMSHELRTPLNSIMILSRILATNEEGGLTAKQVEFAEVIHKSGDDLLNLINDILDLAKIESGKQELVYWPVAVSDVALYLRQMFEQLANQKGLAFEVDVEEAARVEIRADRTRLEQILKNLVSNAIKFTEKGSVAVRVFKPAAAARPTSTAPDDDSVAFAVIDTGEGISADRQQIIFEAFAQAEGGTSRRFGGTGLGLAIARQLAVRMGGEIRLESEPGRGSTFALHLPAREPRRHAVTSSAPPAVALMERERRVVVPDDRWEMTPGEPCFLVIEDDPDFAGVLVDLIRQGGFRALAATSGKHGLDLAGRFRPSGILLDVGLPDLDGWGVMELLQADRATREIPVHFITAGGDSVRARRMGAVGFLNKPVDPEQIRDAIRTLGNSAGAAVLLVEPDPRMRVALCAVLSRVAPRIEAVGTDEEALAHLQRGPFGVLVLDLALPDKEDGIALLERIRSQPDLAAMPVVVHTGVALTPDETRGLERLSETIVILQSERSMERVLEETRLFLHQIRAQMPEQRQRMFQVVHGREAVLEGKRVLIVDDDMRSLYSLTNALQAKQLHIIAAADGVEALEMLAAHQDTNLVLMDIMMPRMDGHEAIRRIRKQPRFQRLPIIALTARTIPGERQRCLDAGATDYIPKPVDIDRLVSLLRVWLIPS